MKPNSPRKYQWLFWTLAIVGLTADQASKYGIHAWLCDNEAYLDPQLPFTWGHHLIPGAFKLQIHYEVHDGQRFPHVNRGAVNGFLNGWEHGNTFFAVVSFLAAFVIVYWVYRPSVGQDAVLCIALGLILAGTLGNLYDRIVFNGVRDFLHWYYGILWPDFNVADSCLVCGAGLLLLHAFVTSDERKTALEAVPSAEPV